MLKKIIIIVALLSLQLFSAEITNRFVFEGFNDVKLGWETDINKFQSKLLFTAYIWNDGSFSLDPKLVFGYFLPNWNEIKLIPEIIINTNINYYRNWEKDSIVQNGTFYYYMPSIGLAIYKDYKNYFIGAVAELQLVSYSVKSYSVSPKESMFNKSMSIVPNFVFGFKF